MERRSSEKDTSEEQVVLIEVGPNGHALVGQNGFRSLTTARAWCEEHYPDHTIGELFQSTAPNSRLLELLGAVGLDRFPALADALRIAADWPDKAAVRFGELTTPHLMYVEGVLLFLFPASSPDPTPAEPLFSEAEAGKAIAPETPCPSSPVITHEWLDAAKALARERVNARNIEGPCVGRPERLLAAEERWAALVDRGKASARQGGFEERSRLEVRWQPTLLDADRLWRDRLPELKVSESKVGVLKNGEASPAFLIHGGGGKLVVSACETPEQRVRSLAWVIGYCLYVGEVPLSALQVPEGKTVELELFSLFSQGSSEIATAFADALIYGPANVRRADDPQALDHFRRLGLDQFPSLNEAIPLEGRRLGLMLFQAHVPTPYVSYLVGVTTITYPETCIPTPEAGAKDAEEWREEMGFTGPLTLDQAHEMRKYAAVDLVRGEGASSLRWKGCKSTIYLNQDVSPEEELEALAELLGQDAMNFPGTWPSFRARDYQECIPEIAAQEAAQREVAQAFSKVLLARPEAAA
jgi:hypothetical protein